MEQNYRPEDPNVSDLRRAMIIRGALLDGFHMETRPNGTLAFVKHDANKKMVYIDSKGIKTYEVKYIDKDVVVINDGGSQIKKEWPTKYKQAIL